ncbi:MAG: ABC transporter ATP-binding protein, partial [Oxalobacteraceae bacterium]
LDEATSALDGANEAALYGRLRDSGTTLISIAHRPAVLRHHTHVLHLMGEGQWELLEATVYHFDGASADTRANEARAQPARRPPAVAVPG